jgi:hypothetical protein
MEPLSTRTLSSTVSESDANYDITHCSCSMLHGPNCSGLYP